MNNLKKTDRRFVAVEFSPAIILDFFEQDSTRFADSVCSKGLPKDCKFIWTYVKPDYTPHTIVIVVEHDSFEPVAPGAEIPTFIPEFKRTR